MSSVPPISLQQVAAGSDQAQRVKQIQNQHAQQEAAQELAGAAQREAVARAGRVAEAEEAYRVSDRSREREPPSRRRRRRRRRPDDPGAGGTIDRTA
jgi:hypothetical protein